MGRQAVAKQSSPFSNLVEASTAGALTMYHVPPNKFTAAAAGSVIASINKKESRRVTIAKVKAEAKAD
jgi:hypothetical protein